MTDAPKIAGQCMGTSALGVGRTPPPPPPFYDVCVLKYRIPRPHVLSWGTLIMSWKNPNDQFDKNRLSNLFHAQFRGISSWTWKKNTHTHTRKEKKKRHHWAWWTNKVSCFSFFWIMHTFFLKYRSWVLVRTASMRQRYRVRTFCLENSFTTMGSRENRF